MIIVHDEAYRGIGGSDIGAILGFNPYRTAFDAWSELTGRTSRGEGPTSEAAEWGSLIEPVVAERYARTNGVPLYGNGADRYRHRAMPWITGRPDRLVTDADAVFTHGLEIKTTSKFNADDWGPSGSADVPERVACQCRWYMILTGLRRWDVAVLIGGQEYRQYALVADDEIERYMIATAARWWEDHVLADRPPPIDASPSAESYLAGLVRKAGNQVLDLPDSAKDALAEVRDSSAILRMAQSRAAIARTRLAELVTSANARGFRTDACTFRAVEMPGRVQYRALVDELLFRLKADDATRLELSAKFTGRPTVQFRTFEHRTRVVQEEGEEA